jgi:hypothetical protein
MKTSILIAIVLGACASACTGVSNESGNAAKTGTDTSGLEGDAEILSQDECDRRATDGITAANADAEFDSLVREVDAQPDIDD